MNNNKRKQPKPKGDDLVKSLPRGWTSRVIALAEEANKENPNGLQLPTNRSHIYVIVQQKRINHPIWPIIKKVLLDLDDEMQPLLDFYKKRQLLTTES